MIYKCKLYNIEKLQDYLFEKYDAHWSPGIDQNYYNFEHFYLKKSDTILIVRYNKTLSHITQPDRINHKLNNGTNIIDFNQLLREEKLKRILEE